MDWRDYYLREVRPGLELPMAQKYPHVSLVGGDGFRPLGECALLMLVALTGTGKSTALDQLRARLGGAGLDVIPTRRELADWIAIPMAQALADEPLDLVRDRARRFACTRRFAEQAPGGLAAAFSWLRLADSCDGLLFSEGIRGANEIRYALDHFPRWQIVELTLPPLTRLRRLSGRREDFDRAGGTADLTFLPRPLRREAAALVKAGEITAAALAIVEAEAANYGFAPFADGAAYPNYHRVDVEERSPEEVAEAIIRIIEGRAEHGERGRNAKDRSD
ncbi:MAG: hypothetical protein OXG68_06080 [Chloroflexi bacterium]|nr:hypothetical protein [Chloroflexota bacterium]